jgi:hypothetical protein
MVFTLKSGAIMPQNIMVIQALRKNPAQAVGIAKKPMTTSPTPSIIAN